MTIEIPAWLLWALGIGLGVPAIGFILFAAALGLGVLSAFSPFK